MKTEFYKLQVANNQLQFSKQHEFNTLCQGSTWRSVRWDAAGLCTGAQREHTALPNKGSQQSYTAEWSKEVKGSTCREQSQVTLLMSLRTCKQLKIYQENKCQENRSANVHFKSDCPKYGTGYSIKICFLSL